MALDSVFRRVVDDMPVLVDAFDERGLIVVWNRECERVTGYDAGEIVGNPRALELLYPDRDYRERMLAEWRERGDDYRDWEWEVACKDGSTRTVAWSNISRLAPVPGWATWGIGVDVTARRRVLSTLEESEARLRSVLETTPEYIVMADREGRVLFLNRAIPPLSREDIVGRSVIEFVDEDRREYARMALDRVLVSGEVSEHVTRGLGPHGTRAWYHGSIGPIRENGVVVALTINARDITERRRHEERLRQAQKFEAIGKLASGIAHDFNNVLHGIGILAGLTLDAGVPTSVQKRNLESILESVRKSKDVVGQILAFSRGGRDARATLSLAAAVREALAQVRPLIPATTTVETSLGDGGDVILGDPSQIHQMIVNLVVNASDAIGDRGGTIRVAIHGEEVAAGAVDGAGTLAPGPYVVLSVSDTGAGMTPEVRRQALEPFFTTKKKGHGTGLGLWVVSGIVECHHGDIRIESEPGRGARFEIRLPRHAAVAEPGRRQTAL